MRGPIVAGLMAWLALGFPARAAETPFQQFVVDWQSTADSPADVSFLLNAPAGKEGFVRIADGHLVRGNGARFRIWGFNVTGKATVPSKQDAPIVAGRLARMGINCVRFHFLDVSAPRGLIDAKRKDTRELDPAQLDRLDFFVAELKKRGVYTNLNLNVGRTYKPGDGVRDCELLGFAKALTYFDPQLIMLQKEYARQLLMHRNPYTGAEYRQEPAVAIVEMINENSIVESWVNRRLLGKNTRKNPGTWTDIPASYEKALTELYNAWLKRRLSPEVLADLRSEAGVDKDAPIPRLRREQFATASKQRFYTEASFYMDLEQKYFEDMGRYLREELGVRSLLAGTSDHNHGMSGYPLLASASRLDIVDGHVYWQHPNYTDEGGRQSGFTIPNTPMVDAPLKSTVVQLSRSAVAGKPYTVSEVNHPFPSEYACEGIPILAAYAALHDWDGVFWYTLGHSDVVGAEPKVGGHFDFAPDPVKMAQLAAGALVFLRSDVKPASRVVGRSYGTEQVYEGLRMPWSENPYFTPGFPLALPLIHATRITSFEKPMTGSFEKIGSGPIRSDTGELTWSVDTHKHGRVAIDTDRSQALIGLRKGERQQTKYLAGEVEVPFAALTLSTLDGKPIPRSARLLLTASARTANTGMEWNADRTTLENWGKAPTCIEPVTGTAVLRDLDGATQVTVQALDGAGRPLGSPLDATRAAEGWTIPLGKPATVWYVISVTR